jgi:pantetheine-phosphate adenylyltransferase
MATMAKNTQRIAVFPGTFDPMTNGHLDIIRRGCKLFDRLIVAVGENPDKAPWLAQDLRARIIQEVVDDLDSVRVETFQGLTMDYARKAGATAILRGIRNAADLQAELQLATANRMVAGIETVFILPSSQWAYTSSSLIKQIASMGGDVSSLVPPEVVPHLGPNGDQR